MHSYITRLVMTFRAQAMRARGTQLGKMKQLFLSSAHQSYPASPGPVGQKDAAPASGQIHSDSKQGHEHAESAVMQAAVNCAAAGIGSVTLSEHETNVKPTRDSRGTEDDTNGGEAPASGKDNITVDLTSRPEKGDFYD